MMFTAIIKLLNHRNTNSSTVGKQKSFIIRSIDSETHSRGFTDVGLMYAQVFGYT